MKELYVNPGEDNSLDAALDEQNALETEALPYDETLEDDDDSDEDEDEDDLEEEGELPEYYDPDADDQEQPGD